MGDHQSEQKPKLKLLIANGKFPQYFDPSSLNPLVQKFLGLPSIGNSIITDWELVGDVVVQLNLNWEPLRVDLEFIDIVRELGGYIFTESEYSEFCLTVEIIPFNTEFFIVRVDNGISGEEICFLDKCSIEDLTEYENTYKNQPDWVPGEVRLVIFSSNGYC